MKKVMVTLILALVLTGCGKPEEQAQSIANKASTTFDETRKLLEDNNNKAYRIKKEIESSHQIAKKLYEQAKNLEDSELDGAMQNHLEYITNKLEQGYHWMGVYAESDDIEDWNQAVESFNYFTDDYDEYFKKK